MSAMRTGVQYSRSKKEKNSANIVVFIKVECNYPMMGKEILAVIWGIKRFLIFLAPKPFLIRNDCKGTLGFVKNKFVEHISVRKTPMLAIMV